MAGIVERHIEPRRPIGRARRSISSILVSASSSRSGLARGQLQR